MGFAVQVRFNHFRKNELLYVGMCDITVTFDSVLKNCPASHVKFARRDCVWL